VDTVINTNGDGTSNYIMTDHHRIPVVELKEVKIINDSDDIEPHNSYGEEVLRRNFHDKDYSNNDNIESRHGRTDDDDDDDDDEKYVLVNAIEVMESNQRVHPHDYNIEDDNDDQEEDEEEEDEHIIAVAHVHDNDYTSSSINKSQPEHQPSSIVPSFIDSLFGITIPAVEVQGSITPVTQNGDDDSHDDDDDDDDDIIYTRHN